MKKIGEVSNLYNVSPRMLRYYEDKNIITSSRMKNNYRCYDEVAECRIKQILLLKQLDFSVKEIELVFNRYTSYDLIQILYGKKMALKDKMEEMIKLETIIENFIYLLSNKNGDLFESLNISLNNSSNKIRGGIMKKDIFRVVSLPLMKVAVFKGFSETPEDDAAVLANKFIKEHKLVGFRHFGFNNPDPKRDSSVYGYEIWITVNKEYDDVVTKNYNGGLYASITTVMPEIGETWGKLHNSVKEDEYYHPNFLPPNEDGVSDHQWLEECTDYEFFFLDNPDAQMKQLDLLLPIKRIK